MFEIFIKTFSELKWAGNFLNFGELKFSHVKYFRDLEDGKVRGDCEDGTQQDVIKTQVQQNIKRISFGSANGKKYMLDLELLKRLIQI